MKTIPTSSLLTVTNEMDVRGKALTDLIQLYVTGFHCYYGFKNLGSSTEKISFPALFVDPSSQIAELVALGKYRIRILYDIIFYVIDTNSSDVLSMASSGMEALIKLFSNNALGDLGNTNPPSNKFKAYPPYWITSEMKTIQVSKGVVNTGPDRKEDSLYRVGWMQLEILDQLLK